MKLFCLVIFAAFLSGCSENSWRSEIIDETGVYFEAPNSFIVTTKEKELQGNASLYDVKAQSKSGDYIRITALELPDQPGMSDYSQSLKCPSLLSGEVKEKNTKQLIAGYPETVKECRAEDRVGYLAIFVRGEYLITVTVSSKPGNTGLFSNLLSKIGYKPNA